MNYFRFFILIITLGITTFLGFISIRNIAYYYRTNSIQANGNIINGWVVNLNEDNYEITFKMENGDYYKSGYNSDFYQFAFNDTLQFKYFNEYSGEYIHINEQPSEMFILFSYLLLFFTLILVLVTYYQIKKIYLSLKLTSVTKNV
jgi:hypothetical protein